MKKLKVLYIITSLGKGGAERLLVDTCRELNNRNDIEYLIVNLSPVNSYKYLEADLNIVYCNSTVELSILKKTKIDLTEYKKIVEDFKPDIIHSHLYIAEIISREKTYNNIIYISHMHGYEDIFKNFSYKTFFSKRKITDWYEKRRLIKKYKKCNNHFIVISNYEKEFIINNMPSDFANRMFFLPNAIDYYKFYFGKKYTDLHTININKTIELVNVGSFVENKNQVFLIDVIKKLLEKGYKVHLTLVGDGPDKHITENKIKKNKLDKVIEFTNIVNNVEDFLHKSDIYIHSSFYEAFGLALLEAMAAGLPVVCLDGKGNRDIVKNGLNGFMIEKPDANLFAEKIIELISNKKLYSEMSENAVKFAADYDIEKYVKKLTDFYCKIIQEK